MPLAPAAVEMLVSFAAQAGIGLELAAHRRDQQRLAVFEDRDRIARDLHDLVIQRLYATGMSLEGRPSDGRVGNARRVSSAVDALDETIKEIRSAIFSLHARPAPAGRGLRTQMLGVVDGETAHWASRRRCGWSARSMSGAGRRRRASGRRAARGAVQRGPARHASRSR